MMIDIAVAVVSGVAKILSASKANVYSRGNVVLLSLAQGRKYVFAVDGRCVVESIRVKMFIPDV